MPGGFPAVAVKSSGQISQEIRDVAIPEALPIDRFGFEIPSERAPCGPNGPRIEGGAVEEVAVPS
jgi:hypothetical protein